MEGEHGLMLSRLHGPWSRFWIIWTLLLIPGESFQLKPASGSVRSGFTCTVEGRLISTTTPHHPTSCCPRCVRQRSIFQTALEAQAIDTEEIKPLVQIDEDNPWEQAALILVDVEHQPERLPEFVQLVSLLRVGIPSLVAAVIAKNVYPYAALFIADLIHGDKGVFEVIANDYSQYIQNILTTSGLVFSLLVGQTYYFMYQQQEKIYLALFEEVSVAKSLLEQVALVCQGRESLYHRILACIDRYVKDDLTSFNDVDPAILLSARPVDDPLENILFLTSVGEPSIVYQTVKSLRQARAYRLGTLQRKLPSTHMVLLWTLAGIVLFTFPLLGAGSQTIGGLGILSVQSWYLSFIVFGIWLSLGVINELRKPGVQGAYNARTVLLTMVTGLEQELEQRMSGDLQLGSMVGPSIDSDGSFDTEALIPES